MRAHTNVILKCVEQNSNNIFCIRLVWSWFRRARLGQAKLVRVAGMLEHAQAILNNSLSTHHSDATQDRRQSGGSASARKQELCNLAERGMA